MKSVFIRETGIHPWEQLQPIHDKSYITVTLLNQDYIDVWKTWCEFASILTLRWPKIVQWHTKLLPFHSKSQEYISQKTFYKNSKPGDILRKNESTKIYSQIINLDFDSLRTPPNSMISHRTSIIIMQNNNDNNLDPLWHKLSNLAEISKTDDFKIILTNEESITFSFYEAETYGVAQLICHSKHLPYLNESINKINLEEIHKKDIYAYIHR
jgi:hypothetical protein